MLLPILQTPASSSLSFSSHIASDPTRLFLASSFSNLSIAKPPKSTTIRMGGGPRTYPGGVSKWQWKRMQAKKAKQLLRARLARERQIYEMRKRAELSAAVSDLERPWEIVETAPKLFSATADEQLKVLADRFQKPGGFDLWSEKDGPQLFDTVDGVPSARFFPKGVVHSIKPYGRITDGGSHDDSAWVRRDLRDENSGEIENGDSGIGYRFWDKDSSLDSGLAQRNRNGENSRNVNGRRIKGLGNEVSDQEIKNDDSGIGYRFWDNDSSLDSGSVHRNRNDKNSRNGNGRTIKSLGNNRDIEDPESGSVRRYRNEENPRNGNGKFVKTDGRTRRVPNSGGAESNRRENGSIWRKDGKKGNGRKENTSGSNSRVFDMSLQDDGSYGILKKGMDFKKMRQKTERK